MSEYLTRKEAIIKGDNLTPMSRAEAMLKKENIPVFTRKESLIKEALNSGGSGGSLEQLEWCEINNATNVEDEADLYGINCAYIFADLDFGVLVPSPTVNIEPGQYGSLSGLAKGYAISISARKAIKSIKFFNDDTGEEDPSAGEVIDGSSYIKVFKSSTIIMVELNVSK